MWKTEKKKQRSGTSRNQHKRKERKIEKRKITDGEKRKRKSHEKVKPRVEMNLMVESLKIASVNLEIGAVDPMPFISSVGVSPGKPLRCSDIHPTGRVQFSIKTAFENVWETDKGEKCRSKRT